MKKRKSRNRRRKEAIAKVFKRKYPKALTYTLDGKPRYGFCWYYDNVVVYMRRKTKDKEDICGVFINEKKHNDCAPFEEFIWQGHSIERLWDRGITKQMAYEAISKGIPLDQSDRWTKRTKYLWNEMEVLVDESKERPIVIQQHYNTKFKDKYFIDLLPELQQELTGSVNNAAVSISCVENSKLKERIASNADMHHHKDVMMYFVHKAETVGLTQEELRTLQIFQMLWTESYDTGSRWFMPPLEEVPFWAKKHFEMKQDGTVGRPVEGIPIGWEPDYTTTYFLLFHIALPKNKFPDKMRRIFHEYGINLWNEHRECLHKSNALDYNKRHVHQVILKLHAPHHWAISQNHLNK